MSGLVTIFGGSGFVGRYIARRLAARGWRVRVAVRRPSEAQFVRTYGVVGQVEPIQCNIRDDASVALVLQGATAAVNLVGSFDSHGKNTMKAVHVEGAERVARLAAAQGITRFVHVSAIGADPEGPSQYGRTKAEGESRVLAAQPGAVILRPSVIFGPEDDFFNRFAQMARQSPILPLAGGATLFQPVYVDDVAAAAERAIDPGVAPGIYELGGPDVASFRDLMQTMLHVIRRRRLIVNMPFFLARAMGGGFDLVTSLTGGLITVPISRDQAATLTVDNVVSGDHGTFADLGIAPTAFEAIVPDYLWRFRPDGQYAALKESAQHLRP